VVPNAAGVIARSCLDFRVRELAREPARERGRESKGVLRPERGRGSCERDCNCSFCAVWREVRLVEESRCASQDWPLVSRLLDVRVSPV
jgi:hypothetical protein